jgi:hypothetical protein
MSAISISEKVLECRELGRSMLWKNIPEITMEPKNRDFSQMLKNFWGRSRKKIFESKGKRNRRPKTCPTL